MFSTKIMYPWGLEKLKMNAPLEVSSFSRPQNYTVKPPLTARIRMLHPPPPPTSPLRPQLPPKVAVVGRFDRTLNKPIIGIQ